MMRAPIAFSALVFLCGALAACAVSPRSGRGADDPVAGQSQRRATQLRPVANPGAVIAAELAFAQLARKKGQWTAFRATATDDAVMFVPQPTLAQAWLKGRADPPATVSWQPHALWSSCDGSIAVTRGAAQWPDGSAGEFVTVWQRQSDGGHKWVLDAGGPVAAPLPAPEMIAARVASCTASPIAGAPLPPLARDRTIGQSRDASLNWAVLSEADGARVLTVRLWTGAEYEEVLRQVVTPAPGR